MLSGTVYLQAPTTSDICGQDGAVFGRGLSGTAYIQAPTTSDICGQDGAVFGRGLSGTAYIQALTASDIYEQADEAFGLRLRYSIFSGVHHLHLLLDVRASTYVINSDVSECVQVQCPMSMA